MDTKILEQHYGGRKQAEKALGISRQLWDYWEENGIPVLRKYQIQVLTNGKLRANGPSGKRAK